MLPILALSGCVHQDELGVLIALDERLAAMGIPPEAAQKLAQLRTPWRHPDDRMRQKNVRQKQRYFLDVQEVLDRYDLHPFRGQSVGVLGCYDMYDSKHTLTTIEPLLKEAEVTDLSRQKTGSFLETGNASAVAGGRKFDCLITCNVINAPDNPRNYDTILAVANLLKQGGKAVHMLMYGERRYSQWVEEEGLQRYAGQRHLHNYPEGAYRPHHRARITRAMVVEQVHEVAHTPATAELYISKLGSARGWIESNAQRPIVSSNRDARFTAGRAYAYLSEGPEHLGELGRFSLVDLTKDFTKMDAKSLSAFFREDRRQEGDGQALKDRALGDARKKLIAERDEVIRGLARHIGPEKKPESTIGNLRFFSTAPVQPVMVNDTLRRVADGR